MCQPKGEKFSSEFRLFELKAGNFCSEFTWMQLLQHRTAFWSLQTLLMNLYMTSFVWSALMNLLINFTVLLINNIIKFFWFDRLYSVAMKVQHLWDHEGIMKESWSHFNEIKVYLFFFLKSLAHVHDFKLLHKSKINASKLIPFHSCKLSVHRQLASFQLNELSRRLTQAASRISLENFTLYTHSVCCGNHEHWTRFHFQIILDVTNCSRRTAS